MSSLLGEVQAMQNPALGAGLIWAFSHSYVEAADDGVALPLAFIVLPVLLHARTRKVASTTRASSGIRKFEEKFNREADSLFALNARAISMRSLSLRSVRIALASRMLTLHAPDALLWPSCSSIPQDPQRPVGELMKEAHKLGRWCGEVSLQEVSTILRVEF